MGGLFVLLNRCETNKRHINQKTGCMLKIQSVIAVMARTILLAFLFLEKASTS
ncbi:Uncharacterised protein [Streptococcus equi subsp. equi]|nr:hypothetical protein SE071780_01305 [Streptococcus equi subsp. equi]CRU80322.1 Uncharacterised protein [Streptococcus equi subsp. equi]VEH33614.1 Uncharacterised protein [Streptococcus equi subsp. equi]